MWALNDMYVYIRDIVRKFKIPYQYFNPTYFTPSNIADVFGSFSGDMFDLDLAVWLLAPLIISFLLPLLIVLLFYITGIILYIYKLHKYVFRMMLLTVTY